jgi:hypothetical protein
MQAAESFTRKYATRNCRAGPSSRCSLFESQKSSVVVVVADVIEKQPLQVLLVDRNHMVKEVPATTLDPTLYNPVLPWTLIRGLEGSNLH